MLKNLAAQLLERLETDRSPDETSQPRLRFVRLMLQQLHLLSVSSERDLRVTGQADFFALPPLERVQRSFDTWRSSGWPIEFGLLPKNVRPVENEFAPLPEPSAMLARARATVLKRLAQPGAEGRQRLPELVGEIREQDYQFLVPRPPANQQLYYRGPYDAMMNPYGVVFGSVYGNLDTNWDQVEARNFIGAVIAGPLHWLGLADTAHLAGVSGPPSAFRLTDMGRWVLGLGPPPAIQAEGGRVITPAQPPHRGARPGGRRYPGAARPICRAAQRRARRGIPPHTHLGLCRPAGRLGRAAHQGFPARPHWRDAARQRGPHAG